jgi:hypothetical protein
MHLSNVIFVYNAPQMLKKISACGGRYHKLTPLRKGVIL